MAFFGLKLSLDLETRAAHPHQKFQGVPPRGLNQDGGTNFIQLNQGPRGRPNMENRSRDKQGAQPGKPNSTNGSFTIVSTYIRFSHSDSYFCVQFQIM